MRALEQLESKSVFYFFTEISKIPRGSGNEKAISDYIMNFAKERGLFCRQDEAYNVLVKKEGTKGYENAPTVIIQGHIDMVCEKNEGTKHDFLKDPLQLKIEGDFISAEGTTLGADNGIAVAYGLAILDAKNLEHPPIEAVFTTDEEVGMKGANIFDVSDLKGRLFLNLDTEEEGKLLVSCCGGKRASIDLPLERENAPSWGSPYLLKIRGLKGGHSGSDINLQRANANKLMGRILSRLLSEYEIRVATIDGGVMDNAISREADSVIIVKREEIAGIKEVLVELQNTFLHEYRASDSNISLSLELLQEKVLQVFTQQTAKKAVHILLLIPYGVKTMSLEMPGLVESSSNVGIVKTNEEIMTFHSALRSSVASRKQVIYDEIQSIAELTGSKISSSAEYPAWEFNPDSKLLRLFQDTYLDIYGKDAEVESIHAGLECGLFAEKIPGLDMISIGPDMFDVHTPDERVSISSTIRVWEFLKQVLRRIR